MCQTGSWLEYKRLTFCILLYFICFANQTNQEYMKKNKKNIYSQRIVLTRGLSLLHEAALNKVCESSSVARS